MSTAPLPPLDLPREVVEIATTLEQAGFETWCVGGALRDRLLGHPAEDVDLATAATPDQVQRLFPKTIAVGVKYGTVGVLDRRRVLHEVTTFRKDVETDGRHAVVAFGATLEEDLARRDFTINALAFHPVRREWRDPHEGAADLERHIVRAVGDPAVRFAEDYLRILRAIRFAARFGFEIDPGTWRAAVAGSDGLGGLSAERVRDEWFKQLGSARSLSRMLSLWRESGAARIWLPGLVPGYPLASDAPDPRDPIVLTAALTADAAHVLTRLRASNEEVARARAMHGGPAAPESEAPREVRRWLSVVGDAAADLMQLSALRTGMRPGWADEVDGIRARGEATTRGQLAISGADLLAMGIPPGPELGRLLGQLLDLVLDDPARNTREQLLAMAAAWR
ncbi:MAG TPA: CCA tRNA nucleotidyltransferase [Gemmatimonadales bacterium]